VTEDQRRQIFRGQLTTSAEYLTNLLLSGHTIQIGCAENVPILSTVFPTSRGGDW